jgi:hypothetical protein
MVFLSIVFDVVNLPTARHNSVAPVGVIHETLVKRGDKWFEIRPAVVSADKQPESA